MTGPVPTRKIYFRPGYDLRSAGKGQGIHGMSLIFHLASPDIVLEYSIQTGWFPPSVKEEWDPHIGATRPRSGAYSEGISSHYSIPLYEWDQDSSNPACGLLAGRPCFGGHNSDFGGPIFKAFATEGEEAVWKALEAEMVELQARMEEQKADERNFS